VTDQQGSWLYRNQYEPQAAGNVTVEKGSICLNGISLTVARLKDQSFTVAIIPYTYEHTTLKNKKNGSTVNLEFDILGKYVARMLGTASQEKGGDKSEGVTKEMLQNFGFANS
jgi:riboflavin synthase